jgi:hypothetical protein
MRLVEHRVIKGVDGSPYLKRWSLFLPFGASIKLHHILRSDEDRDLHDHPWSFVSIILRGGYWEHTPTRIAPNPRDDIRSWDGRPATTRHWYGVGSVLLRPAPWPHRLEIPPGHTAWSLVVTGTKKRVWGFRTICGWIPHFKYDKAKADGC